jgi:anti-anti-sigma factor
MKSELIITSEQIQREGNDPVMVFHLHGWLDTQSEGQFGSVMQEAHAAGTRFLAVDLAGIKMLTSAGIRAIAKAHNLFKSVEPGQPSGLKLYNTPQQVEHALRMTGFLESIPLYNDLQSAIQSFEG